jgi:hypothetical protein
MKLMRLLEFPKSLNSLTISTMVICLDCMYLYMYKLTRVITCRDWCNTDFETSPSMQPNTFKFHKHYTSQISIHIHCLYSYRLSNHSALHPWVQSNTLKFHKHIYYKSEKYSHRSSKHSTIQAIIYFNPNYI